MAEYIERGAAYRAIEIACNGCPCEKTVSGSVCHDCSIMKAKSELQAIPAADVRPVVLCRDCVNYVESEEVNGEKMCVRDADWSIEDGCYYGFTEYPSPDWFCADGVKREES